MIEHFAAVGDEPIYSPYGYIIGEDAKIYSLTQQWAHGIILALLYPKEASDYGLDEPDLDADVFAYQRFELDNHDAFPVIRVAFGFVSDFSISKGRADATEEQIQALIKVLAEQDKGLNETVQTDRGEMTARSFIKRLRDGEEAHLPTQIIKPPRLRREGE